MSIRIVTPIVQSPNFFVKDILSGGAHGGDFDYFEAPPHIQTLRLKLVLSGTRNLVSGTITRSETLSYTKEITLARVDMRTGISWAVSPAGFSPTPSMAPDGADTGSLAIGHVPALSYGAGKFVAMSEGSSLFFFSSIEMARTGIALRYEDARVLASPEVCGTWTYTDSAIPADDDSGDIEITELPQLYFAGAPSTREPFEQFTALTLLPSHFTGATVGYPSYDVSGWSIAQWRSKLQIYTADFVETAWNGGSDTTVEANVEWELLA